MAVQPLAISQPLRLSLPAPISPAAPGLSPTLASRFTRRAGVPWPERGDGAVQLSRTTAVARLDPISLDDLNEVAGLQTRVDRKYVLPVAAAITLLHRLDGSTRVLEIDGERTFRYQSVYFDTPELTSFRLAALRRRRRFKIRTRTYVDSALCFLEVKTEGYRGGTVKDRIPYQVACEETVEPGRWFVDEVLGRVDGLAFAPTLRTRYRRTTFYIPEGHSRVTIDTDLSWMGTSGRHLAVPQLAVVETKTASAACLVDRLLWATGHRPTRISKYATGLAALHPELPDVPWRRTMRQHLGPPHPTRTRTVHHH
jgi:VTC domain-containing protein